MNRVVFVRQTFLPLALSTGVVGVAAFMLGMTVVNGVFSTTAAVLALTGLGCLFSPTLAARVQARLQGAGITRAHIRALSGGLAAAALAGMAASIVI